jgi:3alpha(or 20beta)-hydroxysteroid dehydrogenase
MNDANEQHSSDEPRRSASGAADARGRVESKVVVITGAAGGLGRAAVASLAQEGAIVIATDVHDAAPDFPAGVAYRRLDVTSAQQWAELGEWLTDGYGRVDGLVNNAAIAVRARLPEIELSDWQRAISVNLTGPLLGIQTVIPLMPAAGSIVNVSSVAGLTGHYPVAYTASKWGVRGLSRVASLELGPRGIRVNTILPGFIETPIQAAATPEYRAANLAATPLGRTGAPTEVASLIVYLISDESSYISGAEIVVDGGLTAHGGAKSLSDALLASPEAQKTPATRLSQSTTGASNARR